MDCQTIAMADQFSAAVRDGFSQRGYHDIHVSFSEDERGEPQFTMFMKGEEGFSQELIDSIMREAIASIGGYVPEEE